MKKVVRKIFFAWNEDKEKLFLEDMAMKGYRLEKVQLGKYTFEEDIPRKLIYQFDFKSFDNMGEEEYLQLYRDSGWDLVCKFSGWYYFSREWEEDTDITIFSNNESKRAKYKRLLVFLAITGFPLYYQTLIFFPLLEKIDFGGSEYSKFYIFSRVILLIVTGLHMFAMFKMIKVYFRLRRSIKE
ncbi:DUF2812 domain-containing protein [Mycoplasmatota bacterium]|nr:DUF2812 domain-containing protein [Mycoplasmatota bacterium]